MRSPKRKDSPTLDAEMRAYEGLADAIAGIITPAGSSAYLGGHPFTRSIIRKEGSEP